MAKNTLRRVSGYMWSQETIKWLMNIESKCFFLSNYQFFHSAVWLPDSHKSGSIWINWPGYSFQREWEWWNKWRRTFPRERPPVIQSHGTWLRSSPPLSGSAVETQAGCWVQFSGTIKEREEKHYGVDLYLEDGENCRRERVKVGCWRFVFKIKPVRRQQTECDQASKTQQSHIYSSTYWRMEQCFAPAIRLLHVIIAQYRHITFELSVCLVCETLWNQM